MEVSCESRSGSTKDFVEQCRFLNIMIVIFGEHRQRSKTHRVGMSLKPVFQSSLSTNSQLLPCGLSLAEVAETEET